MPTSIGIIQSTLRIAHRTTHPDENSIYPKLNVNLEVTHSTSAGTTAYNLVISDIHLRLSVITAGVLRFVGQLVPTQPFHVLAAGQTITIPCSVVLDHYGLRQIEKLGQGKDLTFRVDGSMVGEKQQQPQTRSLAGFSFDFRMPKSDWVENILPKLKFKDVMLLEIPRLLEPESEDVVTYINEAWKQYSMGEYDKVLTECRKALESLTKQMKVQGFEMEVVDEQGKKRKIPNWDKLLGNKDLGDIMRSINQKIWGFVTPGAHAGKAIIREDADFALMITHALINVAIHKLG